MDFIAKFSRRHNKYGKIDVKAQGLNKYSGELRRDYRYSLEEESAVIIDQMELF
ncbi:hypothetical protein [Clostridium estertheticum]|uniref:Uncharacterized protein n=1 Tax=Clostridium estertheticum TaxID=238834 RepID=A0A7Y3SSS7_9CLOT|nr:hypothetical protein [Clostridium estertheticum]NNU74440.1 hypothetical protein [Clostridium estertheticum]